MKKDRQLYDCHVVEVVHKRNRIKIHFEGYPESQDEWQTFSENFPIVRREHAFAYSAETLEERSESFKATLYREIRKHLRAPRMTDPDLRVELPTQTDVYESVFSLIGIEQEECGKISRGPSNTEMEDILGKVGTLL